MPGHGAPTACLGVLLGVGDGRGREITRWLSTLVGLRWCCGVSRDPASAEELFSVAFDRLVRELTTVTGSRAEAEDVVADAFLQALRHWGRVSSFEDPVAWVRKVAYNRAHTRWRRQQVLQRPLPGLVRPAHVDTLPGPDADLQQALLVLPARQREVVVLHHLSGLSVEDVAVTLGVSVGTVKSSLSRGRARLLDVLRAQEAVS